MSKFSLGSALLVSVLLLTGCTAATDSSTPGVEPSPVIAPELIPTAPPEEVRDVIPEGFLTSYGDIIFKVGDGPTWCTISEFDNFVICEHREFDAQYEQLPVPEDCQFTYGYQLRLRGAPVEGSKMAQFTCANANWSDPATAPILASGERITTFGFSCFVEDKAARCENSSGDFIVLGPEAWAMSE